MLFRLIQDLFQRRVPHFLAVYLAASWGIVEFTSLLVDFYDWPSQFVGVAIVLLLTLTPTVFLLAYFHGRAGEQHWTNVEKAAIPLNLLVAAAVVVFMITGEEAEGRGSEPLNILSIAIPYFVDRSDDGSLGQLAVELTEDLIDALHETPFLDVVSAEALRPYTGQDIGPDSLAKRFDVGTLIYAFLELEHDTVTVEVRFVDPDSRPRSKFTIAQPTPVPSVLSKLIVQRVLVRLAESLRIAWQRTATTSNNAWLFFHAASLEKMKANSKQEEGSLIAAERLLLYADSIFAEAELLDPQWIGPTLERGWIAHELSTLALEASTDSLGRAADSDHWIARGVEHCESAARREPNRAAVLELCGVVRLRQYTRLAAMGHTADTLLRRASRELTEATNINPALIHAWAARDQIAKIEGNLAGSMLAMAQEQQDFAEVKALYWEAVIEGDTARAGTLCELGLRYFPEDLNFAECGLAIQANFGNDVSGAWEIKQRLDGLDPDQPYPHRAYYLGAVIARAGLPDSALRVMRRTRETVADTAYVKHLDAMEAQVRAQIGHHDEALRMLDTFLESNPTYTPLVAIHHSFAPIRDDPRFQAMLERYGQN